MKECIATTNLFATSPKGEEKTLRIWVGAPKETGKGDWGCPWGIQGLHDKVHDAVSIDSWHSIVIAIRTIEQLLTYYAEDGAQLFLEKGGEPLLVSELVPRWKPKNRKDNEI